MMRPRVVTQSLLVCIVASASGSSHVREDRQAGRSWRPQKLSVGGSSDLSVRGDGAFEVLPLHSWSLPQRLMRRQHVGIAVGSASLSEVREAALETERQHTGEGNSTSAASNRTGAVADQDDYDDPQDPCQEDVKGSECDKAHGHSRRDALIGFLGITWIIVLAAVVIVHTRSGGDKPGPLAEKPVSSPAVPRPKPVLGVLRADIQYDPIIGDIDNPGTFDYGVVYQTVIGLTPCRCQHGQFPKELTKAFINAIQALVESGATAITSNWSGMVWFEDLVRKHAPVPVFMSPMTILPTLSCCYSDEEKVAILTSSMKDPQLFEHCMKIHALEDKAQRFVLVDLSEMAGYSSTNGGLRGVDVEEMTACIVQKTMEVIQKDPTIKVILLEAAELPSYTDAIMEAAGLPVFDMVACCDMFMETTMDNPRYGVEIDYDVESRRLCSHQWDVLNASKIYATGWLGRARACGSKLGVLRIDYSYPPVPGDIDHPGSFAYPVEYLMIKGLTFELCQAGHFTDDIKEKLIKGIEELQQKGCKAITGDCGFMMWYQAFARQQTALPVVLSSLAFLPTATSVFSAEEQIAVFTANRDTLEPMNGLICETSGVSTKDVKYVFVDCKTVPGFEAVIKGDKVDVAKVTPGMVIRAKKIIKDNPRVRAVFMECTELAPYSDAIRDATGLPVFDPILCCDFFMGAYMPHGYKSKPMIETLIPMPAAGSVPLLT